jgi:hypothetical protein
MKKCSLCFIGAILIFCLGILSFSQEEKTDRATVSFSDPSKPGLIEVSVHRGSITLKGYEGKEVLIEAKVRTKKLKGTEVEKLRSRVEERVAREREREMEEEEEKKRKSIEGMRLIKPPAVTGLTVEEENNEMEIGVSSMKQTVDMMIQVPYRTSLELNAHMDGDITVENVTGDIEVNHHIGALNLTGISGTVVAHTHAGDVIVTFTKVTPDKPMFFSTWSGDIDVTFPANIKADLKMKSERGEIYSDFDIQIERTLQRVEEDKRAEGGKYEISFDKYITGKISGGGPELVFNTYAGDILVRKAK